VFGLAEFVAGFAADAPGRASLPVEVECLFQVEQAFEEGIVDGVRNDGTVLDVVAPVVVPDRLPEIIGLLLGVSSLITAVAVAVSGIIGFVGLIVPHAMRLVVGPDHRVLLPTSAVAGGVFLVATDTIARMGAAELPVGIVTAFIGAPFFLYLLREQEVHAL